jgi:hypothetical protein
VKITELAQMIVLLFSHGRMHLFLFAKNGLGNILGHFFTNASVHPAHFSTHAVSGMQTPLPRICQ